MKRWSVRLIPLYTAIGFLTVWAIAAEAIGVTLILPSPAETAKALVALFGDGAFWLALLDTVVRSVLAFFVSLAVSLAAVACGVNRTAKRVFDCVFSVIRSVPTMSVLLLLLIWLSPTGAPIFVAAIVICPTMYSAFSAAAEKVDPELLEVCKLYRVSRKDTLFQFVLPSMAEGLFEGVASGFALNLKLVISAEAIAQTVGSLGALMQYSKIWMEVEKLIAITVVAILLGIVSEWLIRMIGRRVVKWKRSS